MTDRLLAAPRAPTPRRWPWWRRCSPSGSPTAAATFEPLQPADPCVERQVTAPVGRYRRSHRAASCCSAWTAPPAASHVSREALTLRARPTRPPHRRRGRRAARGAARRRTPDEGRRDPAADLGPRGRGARQHGPERFLKAAIQALPDSVVDGALEDRRRAGPHDRRPGPAHPAGEPGRPGRPQPSGRGRRGAVDQGRPGRPAPRPAVTGPHDWIQDVPSPASTPSTRSPSRTTSRTSTWS